LNRYIATRGLSSLVISDKNYEKIKTEIENHRIFKELSKKLIDLSIEYAKLPEKENDS